MKSCRLFARHDGRGERMPRDERNSIGSVGQRTKKEEDCEVSEHTGGKIDHLTVVETCTMVTR